MPRPIQTSKAETLTFRVEPALKQALAKIADEEHKPIGQLLRELVRERIERRRRHAFEAEARRQAREAAIVASTPNSDEAALLRWLDVGLGTLADEWK